MRSLTLKANYITDATPLKDLELLEALRLDDNPIQDTSVLESMESTKNLLTNQNPLLYKGDLMILCCIIS